MQEESAVYTVFEVLNSRGLSVDALDKCKSMLMGLAFKHLRDKVEAAHDFIEELHGHWKGIYKVIGLTPVPGSEILRFGATLSRADERARLLSDDDALDFYRDQGTLQARKSLTRRNGFWTSQRRWFRFTTMHWAAVTEITKLACLPSRYC